MRYVYGQKRVKVLTSAVVAMTMLASSAGGILPLLFSQKASAAPTVITPSNLSGWFFINDDDTAADTASQGSFVTGPGTPPLGSGSVKLTAGPGQYDLLFGRAAHGTSFSSIETLTFQTHTSQGDAPSLQIGIDYDSTDANTAFQGRAVYQPATTTGSWSSVVDPLSDTNKNWWITDHAADNPCPQSAPCTWSELKAALPNAAISVGWGFKADKDVSVQSVTHVDNVTFNGITYDFETDAPTLPPLVAQTVLQSDFANSWTTWTYHDDVKDTSDPLNAANPDPTTNHKIVANPSPSIGDNGAVRLTSEAGQKFNLATLKYSGTKLVDIASFGFDIRAAQGKGYAGIDVNFNSWKHGPGVLHHGRLIYIPQGVSTDAWSSHEAIASNGQWRWSNMITGTASTWPDGSSAETRSWNDIVAAFPNAYISSPIKQILIRAEHFGGVFFRADGVSTVYYDNVYLATKTGEENVKYNFELDQLAAPVHISPEDGSLLGASSEIKPKWETVMGAVAYEYRVSQNGTVDANNALIDGFTFPEQPGTEHNGTGTADGVYYWQVRAIDAEGVRGLWSNPWRATVDTTPPEWLKTPVHTSPLNNASVTEGSTIMMEWSHATDENGVEYYYQVSYSDEINEDGSFVNPIWTFGPLAEAQLNATGTAPGVYYWHVRACDEANNCTPWTDSWKGTVTSNEAPTDGSGESSPPANQTNQGGQTLGATRGGQGGGSGNQNRPVANTPAPLTFAAAPVVANASNTTDANLDEENTDAVDEGEVQGTTTTNTFGTTPTGSVLAAETDTGCTKLLGICWYWWIPIGIVTIGTIYYVIRKSSAKNQ